jgi:hypothetical protein
VVSTDATFGTAYFGSHFGDIPPTFSCEQYSQTFYAGYAAVNAYAFENLTRS